MWFSKSADYVNDFPIRISLRGFSDNCNEKLNIYLTKKTIGCDSGNIEEITYEE